MPLSAIKEFENKLYSFKPMATITRDNVGGDCKFVADPFVNYDAKEEAWVLFCEVAAPARRQIIGILKSHDLQKWEYCGEAVKGSRESFPYIFPHDNCYYMTPCIEVTPVPGLIPVYKASSLLERWELADEIVLPRDVNDRVFAPSNDANHFYLVYGTRTRMGPALEYHEVARSDGHWRICASGRRRVLMRTNALEYIRSRILINPRLTMRPAGNPIPTNGGFLLPLQGTRTGIYGECLALCFIDTGKKSLKVESFAFLDTKHFCPSWRANHHISYCTHGDQEVFAVDGNTNGANWEVRIFANA